MTGSEAREAGPSRDTALLPCAESCAAFRPLRPDRWSDYGRCVNPRSRFCGYPVRLGRECRNFQPGETPGSTPRPMDRPATDLWGRTGL